MMMMMIERVFVSVLWITWQTSPHDFVYLWCIQLLNPPLQR